MEPHPKHKDRCTLAPAVPDLAALGASAVGDLLGRGGQPATWSRAEALHESAAGVRVRLPLPGTPDAQGRVHERPRGAGTGQVWLERFGPATGWGELLVARFSAPPSASVAERRWNLYCHLRGAGVVTPEPLAVGARGRGPLARHSFLVVREPAGGVPLLEWLASATEPRRRQLGLEALGAALARLLTSDAVLPRLAPEHVLLVEQDAGACTAKELAALRTERERPRRRLPDVVVTDVAGGRLAAGWGAAERRRMLERFARVFTGEGGSWLDAARVLLRSRFQRVELREDWRVLCSRAPANLA